MLYALINDLNHHVVALSELESADAWSYPPGLSIVEADGFAPEPRHELDNYVYKNGQFVYVEPSPEPLNAMEVIKAIYTAMPALTAGLTDAIALRMVPYLPAYNQSQTYITGMLMVKDDEVWRKTLTGWRAVE